jgi:hypothetical protein
MEIAVKVETQVKSINMLLPLVSQIHLANNTLPKTLTKKHVIPLMSAETALGHHAQLVRLALINAGLLSIELTIPLPIQNSLELTT